jgi:hypothetical protein
MAESKATMTAKVYVSLQKCIIQFKIIFMKYPFQVKLKR